MSSPQGPHSQILMTGGGGVRQRFIFYTQKNHNFRMCLPKKVTTFFSIPPKVPLSFFRNPKICLCFCCDPKNPGLFHRPKKSLWAKISGRIPLGPPVIKICEWGPGVFPCSEKQRVVSDIKSQHRVLNDKHHNACYLSFANEKASVVSSFSVQYLAATYPFHTFNFSQL